MELKPDKETLGFDVDTLCSKIAVLTQSIMDFWDSGGWAQDGAASLLDKSMLRWQTSLAMSLSRWVNATSEGDLILEWTNLGALVEGLLNWYFTGMDRGPAPASFFREGYRRPSSLSRRAV